MKYESTMTGQVYELDLRKQTGEERLKCPECSEGRKKKSERCLAFSHDEQVGFCHHCETSYKPHREGKVSYTIPHVNNSGVSDKTLAWFESRGISKSTVMRFGITESKEFMPQEGREMNCINFNYTRDGELVNVKFRDGKKNFKLYKGAELIFYNLDMIDKSKELIICEGEIDAMSFYEAGYSNVISVPNGASKGKMQYFINCYNDIKDFPGYIIGTDSDEPGMKLRSELARRLGKEKCKIINYPDNCKDANDVIKKGSKELLLACVKEAKEYPLDGITFAKDLQDDINHIFKYGYPKADKIGNELDNYIKWRTQEWTVITGAPGSGKSDVIDQITLALSIYNGWSFGVFSPENRPYYLHWFKLAQKYVGKRQSEFTDRMKVDAMNHINNHYFWVDVENLSLEALLDKAKELVVRKGIKGFVIDPWNQIEHLVPAGQTETQYISDSLSKLTNFVQNFDVHIWIVAHPAKGRQRPGDLTLYDISGSAHFYNKTYNGLVVKRDLEKDLTQIRVDKVKFWFVGKAGKSVDWYWDLEKGTRYFDFNDVETPF